MTDLVKAHDDLLTRSLVIQSEIVNLDRQLLGISAAAGRYQEAACAFSAAADTLAPQLNELMRVWRAAALDDKARAEATVSPVNKVPMEVWPIASEPASFDEPAAKFDALLHAVTPAYCVPVHGAFAPIIGHGHRYLVAADGLWLECRRPWLHLIWPIGTTAPENLVSTHVTPFGTLARKVEIAFGKVPYSFIRGLAESGRMCLPNECGGWVSWEHGIEAGLDRLVWDPQGQDVGTPGGLHYARPEHTATLSPCIDLHTHGTAPAFFSAVDDADDAHDVKIAIVLGNLDQPIPTIAARLCCLGVFIPVNVSAEQVFGT